MVEFLRDYGLVVLFAVVFLQAMGVGGPPGKTTLVAAAILASKGSFPIVGVLAVGTVALALGGYVGYWIGRRGGRPLVDRFLPPRLEPLVGRAESFFAAYGPRAVLTARFLPGLKVVAAPAAGLAHMPWRSFLLWHTLAATVFTLGFGLAAFVAGAAAIELLEHYGAYALIPIAAAVAVLLVLRRRRHRARADQHPAARPSVNIT